MSKATHKVAVIGVMKSNGQMAWAGEEVGEDHFEDFDAKIRGGYLVPIEKEKPATSLKGNVGITLTPEEKAMKGLREKYKAVFKAEAPENAEAPAIAKAIKDKKAIETED